MGILGNVGIDPLYVMAGQLVLIIILFVLLIFTNRKLKDLTKKYQQFMQGENGKSLEKLFSKRFREIDELKISDKKNIEDILAIKENLNSTFQKIGLVKYDAFSEMGGKLSFAIALLNKQNNGFVINAMHSSDGCYTYAKEIVNGESFIALGEEERKALDQALQSI